MAKEIESVNSGTDKILIFISIAVFIGSIVMFYFLADFSLLIRVLSLLVGFAIAAVVFFRTQKWLSVFNFLQDTKIEVKKVIWPQKPDVIRTTAIILVVVLVVAIFLWIVDSFFLWIVESIIR